MTSSTHMQRVLVIGSNAFTASHFIDYLLARTDCDVFGISRSPEYDPVFLPYLYRRERSKRFVFQQVDVFRQAPEVFALCDAFRPDVVVNFSAQGEVRNSWKWPEQWYQTNCLSVVTLAEHLRQRDYLKRYVAISTPEVYGATGEHVKESHEYRPSTPYAAAKLAGDLHLMAMQKRYGFPVVFTRAANLYGIHQQLYRIIPRTIIYLKLGRSLELHGRGQARRSFIHARDVADATWRSITGGRSGEVYHLAPEDEPVAIADVVRSVCRLMGKAFEDSVKMVDENFGQDALFGMDADKARSELGWRPGVDFADGIDETRRWIEDNWDFIIQQPLEYVHQPT